MRSVIRFYTSLHSKLYDKIKGENIAVIHLFESFCILSLVHNEICEI